MDAQRLRQLGFSERQIQSVLGTRQAPARSSIEQVTNPFLGSVVNTLSGAVGGAGQLAGTLIEALSPFNGVGENLREAGTDFRQGIAEDIANSRFATQARPGENSFITNISSGGGSLAASLVGRGLGRLGGLTKGAANALPAAAFGLSAGGEQAQGAIEAGRSPLAASLIGVGAGGTEAALEKIGLDYFMGAKQLTPLGRIVQRMFTEGIQEASQSLAQSGIRGTYTDVDLATALKQAGTEGFYGAIVGGLGDVAIDSNIANNLRNIPVPGLSMQQVNDPLIEEAKKYKSAEEFIDAQRNFRDAHAAPSQDLTPIDQKVDEGGEFSLTEVLQGYHNQPDDYFSPVGARYYMYDDKSGMESYEAIQQSGETGEITVYRAVPNEVDVETLIDYDWVSPSMDYTVNHGESRFGEGQYKVIEQTVPTDHLWWDGNDIREWGYDTGNTKVLNRQELKQIWEQANKK